MKLQLVIALIGFVVAEDGIKSDFYEAPSARGLFTAKTNRLQKILDQVNQQCGLKTCVTKDGFVSLAQSRTFGLFHSQPYYQHYPLYVKPAIHYITASSASSMQVSGQSIVNILARNSAFAACNRVIHLKPKAGVIMYKVILKMRLPCSACSLLMGGSKHCGNVVKTFDIVVSGTKPIPIRLTVTQTQSLSFTLILIPIEKSSTCSTSTQPPHIEDSSEEDDDDSQTPAGPSQKPTPPSGGHGSGEDHGSDGKSTPPSGGSGSGENHDSNGKSTPSSGGSGSGEDHDSDGKSTPSSGGSGSGEDHGSDGKSTPSSGGHGSGEDHGSDGKSTPSSGGSGSGEDHGSDGKSTPSSGGSGSGEDHGSDGKSTPSSGGSGSDEKTTANHDLPTAVTDPADQSTPSKGGSDSDEDSDSKPDSDDDQVCISKKSLSLVDLVAKLKSDLNVNICTTKKGLIGLSKKETLFPAPDNVPCKADGLVVKPQSELFVNLTSKRVVNVLLQPAFFEVCNRQIRLNLQAKSGKYKAILHGNLPCEDSSLALLKDSEECNNFCGLVQETFDLDVKSTKITSFNLIVKRTQFVSFVLILVPTK